MFVIRKIIKRREDGQTEITTENIEVDDIESFRAMLLKDGYINVNFVYDAL